jgi:hypothetical protein
VDKKRVYFFLGPQVVFAFNSNSPICHLPRICHKPSFFIYPENKRGTQKKREEVASCQKLNSPKALMDTTGYVARHWSKMSTTGSCEYKSMAEINMRYRTL